MERIDPDWMEDEMEKDIIAETVFRTSLTDREAVRASTLAVVGAAWRSPFTTKCDFARSEATYVGIGASWGWLTLWDGAHYGTQWRATAEGLRQLDIKEPVNG